TILDLAKLILKLTNSASKIVHVPPLEEGDMTRRKPDVAKMRYLLNREPLNIEDGIAKVLSAPQFV
ncbi:MAG: epimerase, partial [Bacteroidia bacterium]|nr:epimerase [Bacteroidia bacterium]